MKPLLRWTFGGVGKLGIEVLRLAVRRFRSIYPEFDCVICYNNLRGSQLSQLFTLGVPLHPQGEDELGYPLLSTGPPGWRGAAPGWGWKLCPPRLRQNCHELFVDNDLFIRERLPEIDAWLSSDKFIIARSHRDDPQYYGRFAVPAGTKCCAGLFGLPPYYDFSREILERCKILRGTPLKYYDEQGLVTSVVLSKPHIITEGVVNVKEVPQKPFPPALHFIGVNRQNKHDLWEKFCRNSLLTMV